MAASGVQGPFGPHDRRSLGGVRRQAWRPGHGSGEAVEAPAARRRRRVEPAASGSAGRRRSGSIWPVEQFGFELGGVGWEVLRLG